MTHGQIAHAYNRDGHAAVNNLTVDHPTSVAVILRPTDDSDAIYLERVLRPGHRYRFPAAGGPDCTYVSIRDEGPAE